MKETWEKVDGNGVVIERGISEKAMDAITLKKDSRGNILWEIKAYGLNIDEAMRKAIATKEIIEAKLNANEAKPQGVKE